MTKVLTDPKYYTAIANAIRAKNGSTAIYKPSGMADAITALTASGSGSAYPNVIEKILLNWDSRIMGTNSFLVYQQRKDLPHFKQPIYFFEPGFPSATVFVGDFSDTEVSVGLPSSVATLLNGYSGYVYNSSGVSAALAVSLTQASPSVYFLDVGFDISKNYVIIASSADFAQVLYEQITNTAS